MGTPLHPQRYAARREPAAPGCAAPSLQVILWTSCLLVSLAAVPASAGDHCYLQQNVVRARCGGSNWSPLAARAAGPGIRHGDGAASAWGAGGPTKR